MKTAIVTAILGIALLVPGLVLACDGSSVTAVRLAANCDGWSACFDVEFVGEELVVDLDYGVTLLGENDETLEYFLVRAEVSRQSTEVTSVTYCVEEIWEGYYDNPPFRVAVAAEICGTDAVGEIIEVDCVVANGEQSWDSIKSLYR